jgi:hypothetical protein
MKSESPLVCSQKATLSQSNPQLRKQITLKSLVPESSCVLENCCVDGFIKQFYSEINFYVILPFTTMPVK